MLSITHTKNLTGAIVSGDYWDIDELNHAIYAVIGDEGKYYDLEGSRARVLKVCLNLRQAGQGDRNIEFVKNGLHKNSMKEHTMVAPEQNIYFTVEIVWPELIFTTIALNDFIKLYQKDHSFPLLDAHITAIRKFQSAVGAALSEVLNEEEFLNFMKLLSGQQSNVHEFAIQYVDVLNLNYINMTREEREKSLGTYALKLSVQDNEYIAFRNQVIKSANVTKSTIHDLALTAEYPEDIEW
jgi:hypothetical protein